MATTRASAANGPRHHCRAGALEELIEPTVGETFCARDPQDLVTAIGRLYERDLAAVGHAARRRAESSCWDTVLTQLIGRYWRLMAAPDSSPREVRRAG